LQYSNAEPTGRVSTRVASARAWRSAAPGRFWRFTARAGLAKAAQVRDLVAFDDGEQYARHVQLTPVLLDIGVNLIIGGSIHGCNLR
jgi:hypothetical protein